MHLLIPAGPRLRTRHALLCAILPGALAAFALPSAAQAGFVAVNTDNSLTYIDANNNEANNVTVEAVGNEIRITDPARISAGNGCQVVNLDTAFCPINVRSVNVRTLGGDDHVRYRIPHRGTVELGEGSDTAHAAQRAAAGRTIEQVDYFGDHGFANALPGHDIISYAGADRGVSLTPEDGAANDGRPGDRENVGADFEIIHGSALDDVLFGTPRPDMMFGDRGRDELAGGGGDDRFVGGALTDGADEYHGGPGRDTMDYAQRTQPLTVFLDNVADDGETNEHDNVRSNVENVIGGSARDTLHSLGAFSRLDGRGGDDLLFGENGPDTLLGGPGVDLLDAGSGNDVVDSRDGGVDDIDCGSESDTLQQDTFESRVRNCESVQVGVLRLTPQTVRAAAGEVAQLRLSWRHPLAWRKLRTIELRLYRDAAPVGEITIRPRGERISADGSVELVRTHSRLTRKGKTVSARLALRLDESLAGQQLAAEVEAVDVRGARQVEFDAGSIRVAE